MPQCEYCGKALVTIGSDRKNGKPHADWATRKYHKKCWKELQFVIKWGTDKEICLGSSPTTRYMYTIFLTRYLN